MTIYQDDTVTVTEGALTLESYRWRGDKRTIAADSIRDVERFDMGFWSGKYRLVGIGFGRPRNWFAFGKSTTNRTTAISIDDGSLIKPTFVPDDPTAVEEALRQVAAG